MKDLKPLLRDGASDFERQLLGAAMRERPSPQLRSRMRRTLGLTGPLAWASGVKAMVAGVAGKAALGVAIVGVATVGVVELSSLRGDREADSASLAPEAPGTPATESPAAPSAPAAVPAPVRAAPQPNETGTTAPQDSAARAEPSNGDLREEIQLLDEVRGALQRGSSATALERLDRYRQRFPSGILSREAALLRQQATAAKRPSGAAR